MTRESVDVAQLRERLEVVRNGLRERHQQLNKHIYNRDEPLPSDFSEQAVELENDEAMVAIDRELTKQLRSVEAALARFDDGTYGLCTNCGEAINPERLTGLPESALCMDCATAEA